MTETPCATGNCCIKENIKKHGCAPYVNLIYRALIWEKYIAYAIIVALFLVNFTFVRRTELSNITYICLLAIELFWLHFIVNFLKLITPDETKEQEALDFLCAPFSKCSGCCSKLTELEAMKKFKDTPFFMPVMYTGILLVVCILAQIFKGPFITFLAIVFILVAPGAVKRGYHLKGKQMYMDKIHPKIKELYEKHGKPEIDRMLKKEPAADAPAPSSSSEAPAEAPAAPAPEEPKKE